MAETPVDLAALDELVCAYLDHEGLALAVGKRPEAAPEAATRKARRDCERARTLLCKGEVAAAMDAARQGSPRVFDDQRLLFAMMKQQFVETLRRGDKAAALSLARETLAPLASGAYPEAYEEFKRCMTMLAYSEEDKDSPVAEEWSEGTRTELAGMLSQTLRHHARAQVGALEPKLVPLLVYLIYLHSCLSGVTGVETPVQGTLDDLLPPDCRKEPQPLPPVEVGGPSTFPEVDVQEIVMAVGVPRRSAVAALKLAGGSVSLAWKEELGRRRVDRAALDSLVYEYACFRGLLAPPPVDVDIEDAGPRKSAKGARGTSPRTCSGALAGPSEGMGGAGAEDMEVDGEVPGGGRPLLQWKGPPPPAPRTAPRGGEASEGQSGRPEVAQLLAYAGHGDTAKVSSYIRRIDPLLFERHPTVLFEIKRLEFARLVADGKRAEALALARDELSPITLQVPSLEPALKDTLMGMTAGDGGGGSGAALQAALVKGLGIREPSLLCALRVLLGAHAEWFKLQRCNDPFGHVSGAVALRGTAEADAPMPGEEMAAEAGAGGGQEAISEDGEGESGEGESGDDDGDEDVPITESAILTLMEFLALSRPDAITLLQDHQGSAEMVLAHMIN